MNPNLEMDTDIITERLSAANVLIMNDIAKSDPNIVQENWRCLYINFGLNTIKKLTENF